MWEREQLLLDSWCHLEKTVNLSGSEDKGSIKKKKIEDEGDIADHLKLIKNQNNRFSEIVKMREIGFF
jgi:hypothetical protein